MIATPSRAPSSLARRALLKSVAAATLSGVFRPSAAQSSTTLGPTELPDIPALATLLAGRAPRWERIHLELPTFADNGQAVPMKLTMSGPFEASPSLQAIHLFSEKNPVAEMAVFEFPALPPKVEIDSRIRLAGSQRIVALAVMSDGTCYASAADVLVTIAGCLDGS
jgi:sulfur-oxidizing protein SoxY